MLSNIINNIVKYLLLFLSSFLWIYYYNHDLYFSFYISVIISMVVGLILSILSDKKMHKKSLSQQQKKDQENLKNYLLISKESDVATLIYNSIKQKNTDLTLKANDNHIHIINQDNLDKTLIVHTSKTVLTIDDIMPYIKANNKERIVLLTISFDTNILDLLKRFDMTNIKVYDWKDIYFYIVQKYEIEVPKINIKTSPNKIILRDLGKLILQKQNFKGYFISAIILLISSMFIRNSLYYLISCTIFLILSALCYFDILHQVKSSQDII